MSPKLKFPVHLMSLMIQPTPMFMRPETKINPVES